MLALCSMLHPTDCSKNYVGIMGAGLPLNIAATCMHFAVPGLDGFW